MLCAHDEPYGDLTMSYDSGSYNDSGFKVFAFSMAFSLLFFVYIGFVHEGVDLKEIPDEVLQNLDDTSDKAVLPLVDIGDVENPWVESADMIAHGEKVYQQSCALCHGKGGLGDGVAGQSLPEKPRNFVEGNWESQGTLEALYEVVRKGQGKYMAPFAHLPKNDRWAVVHYIRSITKNKVVDDPTQLEAFGKAAE